MLDSIKQILIRHRAVILYLFFGGCTTLVNILVYLIATRMFALDPLAATVAAWFLSVLFAYVTNKIFVFESREARLPYLLKEAALFFAFRILSGVLDTGMMWIFVTQLGVQDLLIKIVSNIVVVILNYIFSKLWIFRNKNNPLDKARPSSD